MVKSQKYWQFSKATSFLYSRKGLPVQSYTNCEVGKSGVVKLLTHSSVPGSFFPSEATPWVLCECTSVARVREESIPPLL
ncbi:unnamed protein product [Callosobruchus maculatus]|uniref:Uncharacterized protein n=1 Tax=Callosobruchus maculatus TaxID=64391 RepID=A0A653DDJ8_CALMS|nr:unnamed protein product [Callosobruchus maculatus]